MYLSLSVFNLFPVLCVFILSTYPSVFSPSLGLFFNQSVYLSMCVYVLCFQMHLDVCRNAYMQMNVKISLFSLTTSIAAVIAGIFGMNLPIWEASPIPPAQPSHPSPSHERATTALAHPGVVGGDPYHRLDRYREEQHEAKNFDEKKKKTIEERKSSSVDTDAQPIFDNRSPEVAASSFSRDTEDLLDSPSPDGVPRASGSFVEKSLEVIPGRRGGKGELLAGGRTAPHNDEEDEEPGEDEGTLVPGHRPSRVHAKQAKKTSTALSSPHSPVQDGVETDSEHLTSTSAAIASSSSSSPGAPLPLRPRSILSQVTEKAKDRFHYSTRLAAIRDEVLLSLQSVRDNVHTWFLDHAFGVVACAVVLPICLSGFLFCNQFARIFALHGCLKRNLSSGGRFDTMRRSQQHLGRINRLRILLSSYLFPSASSRSAFGHHHNNRSTFVSRILKSYDPPPTSSSSSSSRSPPRGEVREVVNKRDRGLQGSPSSSSSSGRPSSFSPVITTVGGIQPLSCSSPGGGGVEQKTRTSQEGGGKEKTA